MTFRAYTLTLLSSLLGLSHSCRESLLPASICLFCHRFATARVWSALRCGSGCRSTDAACRTREISKSTGWPERALPTLVSSAFGCSHPMFVCEQMLGRRKIRKSDSHHGRQHTSQQSNFEEEDLSVVVPRSVPKVCSGQPCYGPPWLFEVSSNS